jgi:ATP/maltotriose-dependent transcriptional regulator MalT
MLLAAIPHNAPIQHKTIIFSDYPAATLTERETEVLALLASPLSLQEIGDKLFISYSTVRQHTGHIYEKLGVNKRRHAVLAANKLGLL